MKILTKLLTLILFAAAAILLSAQNGFAQLTIEPTTWNVIGLDSNQVNTGPNKFPVGAEVCNIGGTAINNVTANFVWDSSNIYLTLDSGNSINVGTLAGGTCTGVYFIVVVTRNSSAYDTTRGYHISVSGDLAGTVSTPIPRELYVEQLISQNRNSTLSIIGPSSVYVGGIYNFTLNAQTAIQGYEQLETFLPFPAGMFQTLSIAVTYTAPPAGTNDKFYADACGWDNNPGSLDYRSCIGPVQYPAGKAGGTISVKYTVKVVGTGTSTLSSLIYDFSGNSYHYNDDYGDITLTVVSSEPVPNIGLVKSCTVPADCTTAPQLPDTELTYQIDFSNTGARSATNLILVDAIPDNTDFKLGSAAANTGSTGLTFVYEYSSDYDPLNPTLATWTYTPVSAGGGADVGYDRLVKAIRWRVTAGNLSQTSPNNSGSVGFISKIR
jgi:uncharacterized repeat protein (TIGR01451 family)